MREPLRICLIGLGEAGFALARDLLERNPIVLRVWDRQFSRTDQFERNDGVDRADSIAEAHWSRLGCRDRIERAESAASAARDCAIVLSAVTADEALLAAASILPELPAHAWFVDFNSVSPGTKLQLGQLVAQAGGRFVEAAIMSPIAPQGIASPIFLAGPHAQAFAAIGSELGFTDMRPVSPRLGVAAAAKMCRSVIVKGLETLVTESLLTARHFGVEAAVLDSLAATLPGADWPDRARYLISRSLRHGRRRAEEMREVAKTVSEAGLTPWLSAACAERHEWAAQFGELADESALEALLDAINTRRISRNLQP